MFPKLVHSSLFRLFLAPHTAQDHRNMSWRDPPTFYGCGGCDAMMSKGDFCWACQQFDHIQRCAECLAAKNQELKKCDWCERSICTQHTYREFEPKAVFCLCVKTFKGERGCAEFYVRENYKVARRKLPHLPAHDELLINKLKKRKADSE